MADDDGFFFPAPVEEAKKSRSTAAQLLGGGGLHGASGASSTKQSRAQRNEMRSMRHDPEAVSLPGANRSQLGGLFAGGDNDDMMPRGSTRPNTGAAVQSRTSAQKSAAPRGATSATTSKVAVNSTKQVAAGKPASKAGGGTLLWSGSGGLFRYDEGSGSMNPVDANEGHGNQFGAAVKAPPDGKPASFIIYYSKSKKPFLKMIAQGFQLDPPNEENISFYDDQGTYWTLQLSNGGDAVALIRVLLAAKALASGAVESLTMFAEEGSGPISGTAQLRAKSSLYDVASGEESMLEDETEFDLHQAQPDQWWGTGVGALAGTVTSGSAILVAVPPGAQSRTLRQQGGGSGKVLLLDLEHVLPARKPVQRVPVKPVQSKVAQPDSAQQSQDDLQSQMAQLQEQMAQMVSPPPPSNFQGGRGSVASFSAGGAIPGALPASPTAAIIMQYWNAVQQNGLGTPFGASVGALPQVPGLNMQFSAPSPAPAPGFPSTTPGPQGIEPFHSSQPPPSWSPPSHSSLYAPTKPMPPLETHYGRYPDYKATVVPPTVVPPRSAQITSVTFDEFKQAMRDLVRTESGHDDREKAERQKFERQNLILEDELQSVRSHQDQLRESHREQTNSLQQQLSEARLAVDQMRNEQFRMQSDLQMRMQGDVGRTSTLEAELQQCRAELQQARDQHLRMQGDMQMRSQGDVARSAAEDELQKVRAELQQLRQEQLEKAARQAERERSRESLETELQRCRSELERAKLSSRASPALSSLEPQAEEADSLRIELRLAREAQAEVAAAACRSALAITFFGFKSALEAGALVEADTLSVRARTICQRCSQHVEEQLRQPHDPKAGDWVDWDAVETVVLEGMRKPLPNMRGLTVGGPELRRPPTHLSTLLSANSAELEASAADIADVEVEHDADDADDALPEVHMPTGSARFSQIAMPPPAPPAAPPAAAAEARRLQAQLAAKLAQQPGGISAPDAMVSEQLPHAAAGASQAPTPETEAAVRPEHEVHPPRQLDEAHEAISGQQA